VGIVLTAGTAVQEPILGLAKGAWVHGSARGPQLGEGTQSLRCAYLAAAVLAGLLANTLFGVWWPDGVVALTAASGP
jgi:hypothetical protein